MADILKKEIDIIRRFNRYYTNMLGLLDQHILKSKYSLSETRVLLEIAMTENCTLKYLTETLFMDSGYLSRIIKNFEKNKLIEKRQSVKDKRTHFLLLTFFGKEQLDLLQKLSEEQIYKLIRPFTTSDHSKLVQSMIAIESILMSKKSIQIEDIDIRHNVKPGDAGYITYMHGWIYKQEYNYSTAFEAYVAKSFYDFFLYYDANKDRLWVAEHNGEIIGCIGVVARGEKAQLRWFLLHPKYRGIGLGKRLLNEAIFYCREKHYKAIFLQTTNDLEQAIGIYTKAGFIRVAEKENNSWRDDLTELEFELTIR